MKVEILRVSTGSNLWADPAKNYWTIKSLTVDGVYVESDDGVTGFLENDWRRFNNGDFWELVEFIRTEYVTFHTHSDFTNGNNLYLDASLHAVGSQLNDVFIGQDETSAQSSQELECANKLYFIDELGQEVRDRVERTNFKYPQWEDTYHIYTKMGSSYPEQPCCYPSYEFNQGAGTNPSSPAIYKTPQKFITYSYDLTENNHYDAGTYLAIQMDKGGTEGLACYQGDINQAIFVSILLENEI